MSNTLAKNIHQCFPIIKRHKHQITNSSLNQNINNYHRHRDNHHSQPQNNTTYTKTYNSLFENVSCLPTTTSVSDTDTKLTDTVESDTPDLTAAYASRRFFISSPGRSNSIVDSLSSTEEHPEPPPAVVEGVAVETYSPNPYMDFRRSMEEMVVAREMARGVMAARGDISEKWHYLQELLLSYLSLNPKNTHKYIVKAFGDMVVSKMSPIINYSTTSSSSSPFSPCNSIHQNNNNSYVEIFNNINNNNNNAT